MLYFTTTQLLLGRGLALWNAFYVNAELNSVSSISSAIVDLNRHHIHNIKTIDSLKDHFKFESIVYSNHRQLNKVSYVTMQNAVQW